MRSILLVGVIALAFGLAGCGSGQADASKQDEARFRDRKAEDIHAPPINAGGAAPGGVQGGPPGAATLGPPPGAGGPPPGVK